MTDGSTILVRSVFVAASVAGNGGIWYLLMLGMILLDGERGLMAALHMAIVGALGLVIYKYLKSRLVRERPFITWNEVRLGTRPLDMYSFPSGHTLHAVAFTLVALNYYPELALALVLLPLTTLIAGSRVVLGLHYPTDVVVGALIGAMLASGTTMLLIQAVAT